MILELQRDVLAENDTMTITNVDSFVQEVGDVKVTYNDGDTKVYSGFTVVGGEQE